MCTDLADDHHLPALHVVSENDASEGLDLEVRYAGRVERWVGLRNKNSQLHGVSATNSGYAEFVAGSIG